MKVALLIVMVLVLGGCGKTIGLLKSDAHSTIEVGKGIIGKLVDAVGEVYEIGKTAVEDVKDDLVITKDAVVETFTTADTSKTD